MGAAGGRAAWGGATSVNWPDNLDLAGGAEPARINQSDQRENAHAALAVSERVIDGVSNRHTPIIVDGTMYVTDSRGSVYALDAADGHLLWSYDVTKQLGGGARGLRLPEPRVTLCERRRHTAGSFICSGSTRRRANRSDLRKRPGSVILDVTEAALS